MRTKVNPGAKDAFQQRAKEKETQREELFGPEAVDSGAAKEYARQQVEQKPKRITVSKPEFRGKF